jgi:uncharacterized protein YukE
MDEALFERFCLITAENDRLTDALASMKRQRDRLMGALEGDAAYSNKENNHWQYLAKQHEGFFGAAKVEAKEAKEAVSKLRSAINGMLSSKAGDAVSALQAMKDAFLETASLDPNGDYELDSHWDEA